MQIHVCTACGINTTSDQFHYYEKNEPCYRLSTPVARPHNWRLRELPLDAVRFLGPPHRSLSDLSEMGSLRE